MWDLRKAISKSRLVLSRPSDNSLVGAPKPGLNQSCTPNKSAPAIEKGPQRRGVLKPPYGTAFPRTRSCVSIGVPGAGGGGGRSSSEPLSAGHMGEVFAAGFGCCPSFGSGVGGSCCWASAGITISKSAKTTPVRITLVFFTPPMAAPPVRALREPELDSGLTAPPPCHQAKAQDSRPFQRAPSYS